MTKIEIEIPEDMNDKNSVFSHCLSFIRDKLSHNDEYQGVLKPLGNTELISERHLAGLLSKKLDTAISESQIGFYKREYSKETGIKINPIKKHNKVTDSKVYLKDDVDDLIDFITNKLSGKK